MKELKRIFSSKDADSYDLGFLDKRFVSPRRTKQKKWRSTDSQETSCSKEQYKIPLRHK